MPHSSWSRSSGSSPRSMSMSMSTGTSATRCDQCTVEGGAGLGHAHVDDSPDPDAIPSDGSHHVERNLQAVQQRPELLLLLRSDAHHEPRLAFTEEYTGALSGQTGARPDPGDGLRADPTVTGQAALR